MAPATGPNVLTRAAGHRPALGAHRLLANGRSAALLGPTAEVDWWCAPDFDSPPLLWSLLDAGGAAARWRDVRLVERSQDPAGPSAWTQLRHRGARFECWDALVDEGLVRLVRALDGDLDVVHELAAGGFDRAWGEWDGAGTARPDGGPTLHVASDRGESTPDGRWLVTRLQARRGEWAAVTVGIDAGLAAEPDRLAGRLGALEVDHQRRLRVARLPGHHPERARDALAVLQSCTYRPTGAVVAAPTTSLPEAPGADRQFDYRYTWLRDASLGISVAALLGHRHAAEGYLAFVRGLNGGGVPSAPVTDVRGEPVPEEREVGGVAGWAGSTPVRVGNDAGHQVQHDSQGLLLEGVSVYLQTGGRLDRETWELVRATADRAAAAEPGPTSGIWELRTPRELVSADIGRWLALDRAVWIARLWRPWAGRAGWKVARDRVRDRVLGALQPDGGLPQTYGEAEPTADASALMAVVFGMLGGGDARAARLVDATLGRLRVGPFLYRYEPGGADGFAGDEGAFLPVSWWAVSALAAIGRVADARRLADELCARLPPLLSEEVDPASGESLGNVPLVWSHAEAARALYVLDAAALRSRFGPAALWSWRLLRYARLRWSRRRPPTAERRGSAARLGRAGGRE